MKILLDTANLAFIKQACEYYPIDGVTTNPTILAKGQRPCIEVLEEIRSIIGKEKMLHVQVIGTKAEEMIEEGEFLQKVLGGNLYIKIPVIPEGFKAMMALATKNIKITATAVCTAQQGLMAAKAGANFVAPYVNRIENICGDGVKTVSDIVNNFKIHNLQTEVLAASFKNVEQIQKVCVAGAQGVTVGEDVFSHLVAHPLTDWSVATFIEDWEGAYGKGVRIF